MLVYDNILLNNSFVMPYSMNINEYYIFFLDNVDIDLLVFLEIFPNNEGVNMLSHLTIFLHFAHPFHISSFHRQWNPLSSLLGLCLLYPWR
jgi:hypothetical protein